MEESRSKYSETSQDFATEVTVEDSHEAQKSILFKSQRIKTNMEETYGV